MPVSTVRIHRPRHPRLQATDKFAEIGAAYEAVGTPDKRAMFDDFGAHRMLLCALACGVQRVVCGLCVGVARACVCGVWVCRRVGAPSPPLASPQPAPRLCRHQEPAGL